MLWPGTLGSSARTRMRSQQQRRRDEEQTRSLERMLRAHTYALRVLMANSFEIDTSRFHRDRPGRDGKSPKGAGHYGDS